MTLPRTMLPFLMVLALALLVAACSSNDSSSSDSRDAKSTTKSTKIEPGSPEGVQAKTGTATFALTPAIAACMTKAGFTMETPPPTATSAAWRHADGSRVAIAATTDAALQVAREIGTTKSPANVDGTTVIAGTRAHTSAATACLDA